MRLIDADALINNIEKLANMEWNQEVGSSKGLFDAVDIIEDAPTITGELKPWTEEYHKVYMKGWNEGRRKLVDAMEREIAI